MRLDLSGLSHARELAARGVDRYFLTETHLAVEAGTTLLQSTWLSYISGSSVSYSGGEFRINTVSGNYLNAVQSGIHYPADGNPLKGTVVADLDYADKLERGFGPFDVKPGMLASPKAHSSIRADGTQGPRYIDVPFQHAESGIPSSVKRETKLGGRALGTIRLGGSLGSAPAGIRSKTTVFHASGAATGTGYTWRSGQFAGLVRNQAGPENRGQFLTFRRVSENSDPTSWIHPGVDPKPVTKALEENLGPALRTLVEQAFERDVLRLSRILGVE